MLKLKLTKTELLYFQQLDERQRRLFAASEALKLGYYGVAQISSAYGINRKTIYKGKQELLASTGECSKYLRKSGGVKKKARLA